MTKNKLILLAAAFSLVCSAAVLADDSGMTPYTTKELNLQKSTTPLKDTTTVQEITKKHKKHIDTDLAQP